MRFKDKAAFFAGPAPTLPLPPLPMSEHSQPASPSPSDLPTLLIGLPAVQPSPSPGRPGPGPSVASASASPRIMSDGQQIAVHRHLLSLIECTGWPMVQNNGQRKFGPPKNWSDPVPGRGCEVFIGRIPRDMFEHELFPILERAGRLYEIRLMMDFSGTNRGFGFAKYATPEEADQAVTMLNGCEVRRARYLGVVKSVDNRRLFVGGLPKEKTQEEVKKELSKLVNGIVEVILYSSVVDKTKNRGFAFVEFESHRVAAIARRRLIPGGVVLWDHDLAVDWAEPEPEVPSEIMAKVRVLYMRNLMLSTSEDQIRRSLELFVPPHTIEKVKKLKDFAFLHFTERRYAEEARKGLDGKEIDGSIVAVVWAKPPELAQKKSAEVLPQEVVKANEPGGRIVLRGAGGLKTIPVSKMSHDLNYALLNPAADQLSIPYSLPYAPVQTTYVSNYEALLSFCRYYSLDSPHMEVIDTTLPERPTDRLVHFARVIVPIDPPNNVVTGQICDTVYAAQESAAGAALTVLYRVYVGPSPFPTVPAAPAAVSPPVIYAPPSCVYSQ